MKPDFSLIQNNIDIKEYLEPSPNNYEYDDVIDEDKRTFCQYYCEKIKDNQMIINTFFITDFIKPKPIKIASLIVKIDIYFLTNCLFYSDSYISQKFNSTEKETIFSFYSSSVQRFIYSTLVSNIIDYIINFFFVDGTKIKKILLKYKKEPIYLRYEITRISKSILKYIKILTNINYFIIIFSWYYLSCFNNVYPNINRECILSSLSIIIVMQIIPFIFAFLETLIRFISIKCESEKLFKISLFLS